jgi:hypothetical protein
MQRKVYGNDRTQKPIKNPFGRFRTARIGPRTLRNRELEKTITILDQLHLRG